MKMADLQLSIAMQPNARSRAVLDGRMKPEGIELQFTALHPSEIFWRQLRFQEFDVSEMSMSSLLITIANGNRDWVAFPVFTTRRFFHTGIWVRNDRGIEKPGDLKGKRVGVPEYQQTAALWGRGVLQHEFGVLPTDIEWFMERTEEVSHGGATGFRPPPGLKFNRIPAHDSIGAMLLDGRLDAALHYLAGNNVVDRSRANLADHTEVRLLFADQEAEARRYFAKTGLFPINHAMVVRRSVAERHPWVVLNLYNAFLEAKERWLASVSEAAQTHLLLGLLPPEAGAALRQDPFPYGVVANRKVLETIAQYSHEQGLTPRMLSLDEIFPSNTLAL
jgi:4,5-dihydroxyphthalate decarboxylase